MVFIESGIQGGETISLSNGLPFLTSDNVVKTSSDVFKKKVDISALRITISNYITKFSRLCKLNPYSARINFSRQNLILQLIPADISALGVITSNYIIKFTRLSKLSPYSAGIDFSRQI